jgi:hypothetical protein
MILRPTEDECFLARQRLEHERGRPLASPIETLRQHVRLIKWGTLALFVTASLTVAVGALRDVLPL